MPNKLRRCVEVTVVGECSQGPGKLLSSSSYQSRKGGLLGPVLLLVQFRIWSGKNAHKAPEGNPLFTVAPRYKPLDTTLWRERPAIPGVERE